MSKRDVLFSSNKYPIFIVCLAFILTACGGGGGGGDGVDVTDEPTQPFPSVVRYIAGSPADFGGSGVDVALEGGGSVHAGFYLEGSYAKDTRAYTLEAHNVPRINLIPSGLPYSLIHSTGFGILIDKPLQWVRGMHLTAGQFHTVPGDPVNVTVTTDAGGSGQPGVDIEGPISGTTPGTTSLTWSQLDGVLSDVTSDPSAWPSYVVEAAFSFQVIRWVYDQIQLGMDGIEFVTLNDPALTAAGSGVGIDHSCDLFPYNGSAGDFHFTWNDGPGETANALGANDNFTVEFHDCWTDEPGQADLWARSGTGNLLGFWDDPAVIALGFDPMVLKNVVETATFQNGATASLGDTVTINTFGMNGQEGFRLVTQPDTSASINLTNAVDVASAAVSSLLLPRQVGDLSLGLLAGLVADPSYNLCDISGTATVTPTPTASTTVPASFDVSFAACQRDPTDSVTLNGTVTLKAENVTGGTLAALSSNDYTASLSIDPIAVQTVDSVGTSTLSGGNHFTRTAAAGDFSETSESLANGLSVSEGGVTLLLQPYGVASTLATSGAYTFGKAGDTMAVKASDQAGAFTVSVVQAVQGSDPTAPISGKLRIVALDGSNLTVTVTNGSVTLDLDTNGDGTIDDTLTSTWADLN